MSNDFFQLNFKRLFFFIILFLIATCGFAQPEITGPQCILPLTTYQYTVSGKWAPSTAVKICITGGKVKGDNTCTPDGSIPFLIFVTWNTGNSVRKIELTSTLGNSSLVVTATSELNGGRLKDADKMQVYDKEQLSYLFRCSESSGGNCSPNYLYQWQVSDNNVVWTNIDGATAKDLHFGSVVLGNTFFRRVTTETNSASIAYSDQATLGVKF